MKLHEIFYIVSMILIYAIVIAFIGFEIYIHIKYYNKTLTEIPMWALILMGGK